MDTAAPLVLDGGQGDEAASESSEFKVPPVAPSRPEDQSGDVSDGKKSEDSAAQDETSSKSSNSGNLDVCVESSEFKMPSVALSKPKSHSGDAVREETNITSQSSSSDTGSNFEEKSEFKVPSMVPSRLKNRSKSEKGEDIHAAEKNARTSSAETAPPPLPYNEPTWSSTPSSPYVLTVIKNGTIIQTVELSHKPYHVFGRLPSCDIQFEHPSISRYHAILQYRPQDKEDGESESDSNDCPRTEPVLSSSISANPKEEGFYMYDLGSTHGTFINKTKIQMRCYYRLRLGQMVKFGGSSRLFLLEVR